MRFKFYFFLLVGGLGMPLNAGLNASLGFEVFHTSELNGFLESWLLVEGKSLTYTRSNSGTFQAQLEVVVMASQQGKVLAFDKYLLSSQSYSDTSSQFGDLFDIHRLALPPGDYLVEWIVRDVFHKDSSQVQHFDSLHVEALNKPSLSGIMWIMEMRESKGENPKLNRGNMEVWPRIQPFANADENQLSFYLEASHTIQSWGAEARFVLRGFLRNADSGDPIPGLGFVKSLKAQSLAPFFGTLSMADLRPGHYELVVELIDSTGTVVDTKLKYLFRDGIFPELTEENLSEHVVKGTFVEHILNLDTLQEMTRCLTPICGGSQKQFALNMAKSQDTLKLQRFILGFWLAKNPSNPALAWNEHRVLIAALNQEFGNHAMRGYETDRGRVYLQYGPPNSVNKRYNEPSAYPYEIWQYYQVGAQTNVRFVFYNPNSIDNDFILIHSDCRGEINNRQWQMFVHNRNNSFDVDRNDVINHYGSWSRDLYNQPR